MFTSRNQIDVLHHALDRSKRIEKPIKIYAEPLGGKTKNYWDADPNDDISDNVRQYYVCTVKNY